ncbi:MAG: CCA tRNA nucleotidyltransferase [Acidimicrobiales bacterium]|nr:MAG: CCA tRNA nucleotidyltransferase [Acidimicrobiales bacterium]
MVPEEFRPVLEAVQPLADAFADGGRKLYLVGGVVRDLYLGVRGSERREVDLTTDARPDEIIRLAGPVADAVYRVGERFGTIGIRRGDWTFEITTHRAEAYTDDSRKPRVRFTDDIVTDLSRRDFTVNAIALELPTLRRIDPHGGLDDLVAKRLRTPLDPEVSFGDDPLRMLRAARFVAAFDLRPDAALVRAVERLAHRLSIVSAERIRDELNRLVEVPDPTKGLWFLVDTPLAEEFLPELPALRMEQDPIHRHKDVLSHTIAVVAKTSPRRIVRLAALFHDVGKPKTRVIGPDGVSFHHHEVVGARMTRDRMRALRYPTEEIEDVSRLVFLHLRFHTYRLGWTDSAVRRFVRDAGHLLDELLELTRCDCTTRNVRKARELEERLDELQLRIEELRRREELEKIRPDLDGREVMRILGISPGPLVGEALDHLLELRLEEGPLGKEEAERRLLQWWERRPHA